MRNIEAPWKADVCSHLVMLQRHMGAESSHGVDGEVGKTSGHVALFVWRTFDGQISDGSPVDHILGDSVTEAQLGVVGDRFRDAFWGPQT